jgi:hypothetical protein
VGDAGTCTWLETVTWKVGPGATPADRAAIRALYDIDARNATACRRR